METGWWYYYTHSTNYTNIALKTSNAEVIFRIYCHNLNTNIPIYITNEICEAATNLKLVHG